MTLRLTNNEFDSTSVLFLCNTSTSNPKATLIWSLNNISLSDQSSELRLGKSDLVNTTLVRCEAIWNGEKVLKKELIVSAAELEDLTNESAEPPSDSEYEFNFASTEEPDYFTELTVEPTFAIETPMPPNSDTTNKTSEAFPVTTETSLNITSSQSPLNESANQKFEMEMSDAIIYCVILSVIVIVLLAITVWFLKFYKKYFSEQQRLDA